MTVGGSKVTKAYFNGQLVFEYSDVGDGDTYVTFTGTQPFVVRMPKKYWEGTIEYSTDLKTWTTWTCANVYSTTENSDYKLYFRGSDNTYVTGNVAGSYSNGFVVTGLDDSTTFTFSVSGDLMTLLDYKKTSRGEIPTADAWCFAYMFYGQNITTCSDIKLDPIPYYGCAYMFYNCTKLESAPNIYVDTLGDGGCYAMFAGCTALLGTGILQFTKVGDSGAYRMYDGCSALKYIRMSGESIKATRYSFANMFNECTGLTDGVPVEIHLAGYTGATTDELSYTCQGMFSGCTSLTTTPSFYIHSGTANATFYCLFKNCTSLVNNLGSFTVDGTGTSNQYMFYYAFYRCTSLTDLPKMNGVTFGCANQCTDMFDFCSSLKKIYSFNKLGGTNKSIGINSFSNMFYNTGVIVAAAGTYSTSYQIVKTTVKTASTIYNYTYKGVTPITDANTVYSTNAEEIVMVN